MITLWFQSDSKVIMIWWQRDNERLKSRKINDWKAATSTEKPKHERLKSRNYDWRALTEKPIRRWHEYDVITRSLPYDHLMITRWLPHDHHVITSWLRRDYAMITTWLPLPCNSVNLNLPDMIWTLMIYQWWTNLRPFDLPHWWATSMTYQRCDHCVIATWLRYDYHLIMITRMGGHSNWSPAWW